MPKQDSAEEMLGVLNYIMDKRLESARYDRTRFGRITAVNTANRYNVMINGREYVNINAVGSNTNYQINDMVPVVIPENEMSNMYIASVGGGGSALNVTASTEMPLPDQGKNGDIWIIYQ